MTDASIDELMAFARYRHRWSNGPPAQGAEMVLALAESCRTPDEILSRLRQCTPGHVTDAASAFVSQFRVPVRDEYVDAVLAVRHLRDAGLAVDSAVLDLADAASLKETCLAAMVSAAEIRDAVCRMAAALNAKDEAAGRPPFTWLELSGEEGNG